MAKNVLVEVVDGMYAGIKRVTDFLFRVAEGVEESTQEKNCKAHIAHYTDRLAGIEKALRVTKHTQARRRLLQQRDFAQQHLKEFERVLEGVRNGRT